MCSPKLGASIYFISRKEILQASSFFTFKSRPYIIARISVYISKGLAWLHAIGASYLAQKSRCHTRLLENRPHVLDFSLVQQYTSSHWYRPTFSWKIDSLGISAHLSLLKLTDYPSDLLTA